MHGKDGHLTNVKYIHVRSTILSSSTLDNYKKDMWPHVGYT